MALDSMTNIVRWRTWVLLPAALAGCSTLSLAPSAGLPGRFSAQRHHLLLRSDFPLPQHHRMLDELIMLRGDMVSRLGIPSSDEPIHLYLFESGERFERFMRARHPEFPDRRAFFVESDSRLIVYAQWGDRMAEDLRHETAHAYLHAVVPNLPLWLDEGLAEFFEVPRRQQGLHRQHIAWLNERMRRQGWQPNLKRLERVANHRDLQQDEYAEAWLWVHFLLESSPETAEILRGYLNEVRTSAAPPPLSAVLERQWPNAAAAAAERLRTLLP